MIHIAVITGGTDEDKKKAESYFKKNSGWQIVMPDVWLLAARATPRAWQDFLTQQVPGLQFLIVRLTREWGAPASHSTASWLKSSGGWF